MTDGVRIENLHIENVYIVPGPATEDRRADILTFIREQLDAHALTIIGEDGFPIPEDATESDTPPTPEEQASLDQSLAEELIAKEADASGIVIKRAKRLRDVAKHVTAARRLEGQRRGYASSPSERKGLEKRQENAEKVAAVVLEQACTLCEFRDDCELTGNITRWIDTHAYKDKAKRRKDSSDVEAVESRKKFDEDLGDGVAAGEQVHCDPAKREPLHAT